MLTFPAFEELTSLVSSLNKWSHTGEGMMGDEGFAIAAIHGHNTILSYLKGRFPLPVSDSNDTPHLPAPPMSDVDDALEESHDQTITSASVDVSQCLKLGLQTAQNDLSGGTFKGCSHF